MARKRSAADALAAGMRKAAALDASYAGLDTPEALVDTLIARLPEEMPRFSDRADRFEFEEARHQHEVREGVRRQTLRNLHSALGGACPAPVRSGQTLASQLRPSEPFLTEGQWHRAMAMRVLQKTREQTE